MPTPHANGEGRASPGAAPPPPIDLDRLEGLDLVLVHCIAARVVTELRALVDQLKGKGVPARVVAAALLQAGIEETRADIGRLRTIRTLRGTARQIEAGTYPHPTRKARPDG